MGIILENKTDQDDLNKQKEKISAVLREEKEKFPLKKALVISGIAHPLIPFLVWFLIAVLAFFGLNLTLFQKPEIKPRDIEFVIVNNKEQPPINKNTRLRADRNSRAGGKHDPTKKISEPEHVSRPSTPQRSAPEQKPVQKSAPQHRASAHTAAPKAQRIPPRPVFQPKPSSPPKLTTHNPFSIPAPKVKAPRAITPMGGPVTTGPIGTSSPSGDPSPMMSNSGRSGHSRGSRGSGYSVGGGDPGNPGPGNPNGSPGIDAIKEPDFGPYMRELQRRIKRNWHPPRGNESKRVQLLFKVSRDGRLLRLNISKSSGVSDADDAALEAVKMSAPFRPLPPEYQGNDIDIQFTFDYNVFSVGGSRY
jgi:TonB family protein